ncbi:hypothetical protein CCMSSC00406_0005434 [Pleurotus cornucopiae]|uniref:Uncharacterized protein n=1 Tax=Pleurotus cornucopiae TaxID=5321 RepID=A0ACB7IS85_PLECO|nr:hypothetical protein CCMSSC00406_0005434 [Pleurotus cornucopiae]
MASPVASSSTTPPLRILSGSLPGLIDPSQRTRLLRGSNGQLIFATHDARAASAHFDVEDVRKLDINDTPLRPKRIVIEISSSGYCRWRFVPKARLEDGVVDEGTWPRVVNICGELYELSHDQWDIYKLDPEYDCYVPASPEIPMITRKPPIREPTALPPTPEKQNGKRRSSPSSERLSKRAFVEEAESSSEDEDDMLVDDPPPPSRRSRSRSASAGVRNPGGERLRKMIQENRKVRREKTEHRTEKLSHLQNLTDIPSPTTPSPKRSTTAPPSETKTKRKVEFLYNSIRATREDPDYTEPLDEDRNAYNYATNVNSKRTRTVSPVAAKRKLEMKRLDREKAKRERWEAELEHRRRARDQEIMESVMADIQDPPSTNGTHHENGHREQDEAADEEDSIDDEEVARLASIEESRRKLAELEADRPLWEAEARRKQQEQAQAEEERRLAEARRRAAEAKRAEEEQKARAQRAAEERRQEEALRRQRAEAEARRERERRQRQQRWSAGPWTVQRALERCKVLSDAFDEAKYSRSSPLTFEDIPWPVLHPPMTFRAEDIEWQDVEKFFHQVKLHMKPQDYKPFVVKCHRRFHPDRWRSRGLLNSIKDETDRNCLEVAANTVAQALTPLWRELK